MTPQNITSLIIEYRYFILIPLSIVEGPIVAFIAGTLASLNYFNFGLLCIIFFVRDMGMDGLYYSFGYFSGRSAFAKRMLLKINIADEQLEDLRKTWEKHPARTMFIGKLSYGVAQAFIIVAGTVRMPLTLFFRYGALVAVLQYGTLLTLGYFFGNSFGASLTNIIKNIQYVIALATVVLSLYYGFAWYMRVKFVKNKKE